VDEYELRAAGPVRSAALADPGPVVTRLLERIAAYAGRQRYEEAAVLRGRLAALLRATIRMQRLSSLTAIAELVAARPAASGGWELAVVRHGRLVAAGVSPPRTHPRPVIEVLLASAETVRPGPGPTPCASAEETERVLAWLERDGTRLVQISDGWALPAAGASRFRALLRRVEHAATQPYVHQ
jgi:DNA polymerase-3 subunit epsilon